MENYITYFLKVNVILTLLFFIYYIMLKKEKFFRLNRFFLLGSVIVSVLLPLVPRLNSVAALQEQIPVISAVTNFYSQLPKNNFKGNAVTAASDRGPEAHSLTLTFQDVL